MYTRWCAKDKRFIGVYVHTRLQDVLPPGPFNERVIFKKKERKSKKLFEQKRKKKIEKKHRISINVGEEKTRRVQINDVDLFKSLIPLYAPYACNAKYTGCAESVGWRRVRIASGAAFCSRRPCFFFFFLYSTPPKHTKKIGQTEEFVCKSAITRDGEIFI